jgi:exodeoxyribonuclease VII small subunit
MAKSAHPSSAPAPITFEAALSELENIVRSMETGQLPLEQSLTAYERGVQLLRHCQNTLIAAEHKLQQLDIESAQDAMNPTD